MKISRLELRKIILEASSEHWSGGQADYEEQQDLSSQMAPEDDYDLVDNEYDARREEDFEAMRASAEDALERIIGAGISSEALIGAIRRDPELRSYRFEDVMSMIDTLDSKDRVSGFLGNQSEF